MTTAADEAGSASSLSSAAFEEFASRELRRFGFDSANACSVAKSTFCGAASSVDGAADCDALTAAADLLCPSQTTVCRSTFDVPSYCASLYDGCYEDCLVRKTYTCVYVCVLAPWREVCFVVAVFAGMMTCVCVCAWQRYDFSA